jgi:hypothetical protein
MASERMVGVRRLVAGAASMALGARVVAEFRPWSHRVDWREGLLLAILVGAPAIAAPLVWTRRLGAQLLARACWWSFLIVGVLGTCVAGAKEGGPPAFAVACSGLALLAIGRSGLEQRSGRFNPVAFRGTLQLSLVLAMADTASLALCGLGWLLAKEPSFAARLLPLAAFTGLGVVGLLRLRTWGLLAAIASNLLVGALALSKVLLVPPPVQQLFVVTAALQAIVPLPMIVRLVLRLPPPPDRWQAFRTFGATTAILGLVAVGLYAGLVHEAPLIPLGLRID